MKKKFLIVSPIQAFPITAIVKASRKFADYFHEVDFFLVPQN